MIQHFFKILVLSYSKRIISHIFTAYTSFLLPMKRLLLLVQLLCLSYLGYAQSGDFYLKEFSIHLPNIDNDNYAIVQDEVGRMRIANRKGLLKFDGTFWEVTHTPGTVFSIKNDSVSKTTFVGCINDFGYIKVDHTGHESYVSISKGDKNARNIAKIEVLGDIVYFLGENILYQYAKSTKKLSYTQAHINNIFLLEGALYASYANHTIAKVGSKDKALLVAPQSNLLFATPINSQSVLVGTADNQLYVLSKKGCTRVVLQDSLYVQNYEVLDAIMISNDNAILATAKGGCLVVNIRNGYTLATINVYSGLPDDEVYAIGKDGSGGVWIAHEFGISRMDYRLPFLCYSNYLGLEGHVETALTYGGKLYVGTNEGLFGLEEVKEYKELIEKKTATVKSQDPVKAEEEDKNKKKERFNFRNFLKRKSKVEHVEEAAPKNVPIVIRKKVLAAIKYKFVRVGDIKGKCNQLMIVNKKLMAVTNMGIYEIGHGTVAKLCGDNVRYLYASKSKVQMHASTADGDLITFKHDGNRWETFKLFDFISQPITCIGEDPHNNLWLAGIDKVYKVRLGNYNEIVKKAEISISNPYSDDIHLFNYDGKFYFSISSQFYYYHPQSDKLVKDPILGEKYKQPENVIYSQNNALWILKNKYWELLADAYPNNENYVYLSLFKNVDEYIIDTEHHAVWVLTDKNQLYCLNLNGNTNALNKPDILVHNVKNAKGEFLSINNFSVLQDESNLLLNVVSPDYYNQTALDYQYKILGHSQDWSHWSNSNTIILNYLPSGEYSINVRSRNAFGQMTEKEAIWFTIEPPFWQKWWFYLIEVVFFGSLWLMSFSLSRSNNANAIIRKALTFLTLVITIEFLSTVAESVINFNVSPVLDFLVKVCIAVSLVPIERYLSGFIGKNNQISSQ